MSLAASRIVVQGETPYAHERAAIDFVINTLPNSDPYHLWALLELLDPSTGRLYEIDLLVLGYSALYLVEVKSGPGDYTGDTQDWYRTAPGERPRYMENPTRLANSKSKILASRLRSKLRNPKEMPWVQPLVFLSAPDVTTHFRNFGDLGVINRDTFKDAMQFDRYTGSSGRQRPRINDPVMRDVAQAIAAIGLKPRKGKAFIGAYELGPVLGEGSGFQDRRATHRDHPTWVKRARIYAVPQASSVERRQQLRRAADRDASILMDVREHANILRVTDYVSDAELGPTVLFEDFPGGMPLDAFLRNEQLDFYARVELIEQVARALKHCHRKGVVHGALSPEAVLVRRHPETGAPEVRLFNFQLGFGPTVDATSHWSALGSEPWAVYQAPELREDPNNRSPTSDMFSLGALAYLVFTGRAPGASAGEVDRHLALHRSLDPCAVDDTLQDKVGELVSAATDRSPINRIDDPEEWIELLLGEVTRPDPVASVDDDINPLNAVVGDNLGDDLLVEPTGDNRPTLGQGATSRVLQVRRISDDRSYALKVSLSGEHDERLEHEAVELTRLRHPRIVQLVARYTFAGRPCLLLSLAGSETLHRCLAREGTVSLDRAARYGDDLFDALAHLEELHILHRDIKPANLGVGSVSNKAAHLTLFDFSLAATSLTDLQVGTAAYRDPFLRLRGSWDFAAERWSAAVTLHEMLTGIRPSFDRPVLDPEATLVLAIERFDPAVRDSLGDFFRRAFAKDVRHRFGSADDMRRAWMRALEATAVSRAPSEPEAAELSPAELAAIAPDTAIEALPLSPRARNALDRAGFLTTRDLHGLADNRLSAIRGIGSAVAKEILAFKVLWSQSQAGPALESKPFFPGYRGEDASVLSADPGNTAYNALLDAGLTTLAAVAESPREQVRALAHRHGFDEKALRDLLERENAKANERERPSTIEGWVDALLPRKKKSLKHVRELFGLDEPFIGRLDLAVRALADHCAITTAAVYLALAKAREGWAQHGALPELRDTAHRIVHLAGGVSALAPAARELMSLIPYGRGTPEAEVIALAAALLRVVVEVEKDDADGLRTLRLDTSASSLWLCASDAHGRGVKLLGVAADELAQRPQVPGPSEAARAFADAVVDTPLSVLSTERLADIAAAASSTAARSARLEIYPRGMEPERALALSASQLKSGLTSAEIRRRVSLRYPDAQPLPDHPELDALLVPHGLVFDVLTARYTRPGETEHTLMSTRVSSLLRVRTALPSEALSMEPDAVAARQFDERLRNAYERHELRVLGVRANRAREAALVLGERLGTAPIEFDKRFVAAIREQMRAGGMKREEPIHLADREGRTGASWKNLMRLVERAEDAVMASLLPPREPLLLVQPGLIARYRLDRFIAKLFATPRDAPVFLLVPSPDTGGIPTINGDYPIPGLLASQVLWVSLDWLSNRHNRAAQALTVHAPA